MKKHFFLCSLIFFLLIGFFPETCFAEVSSTSDLSFVVNKNVNAGLNGDVNITFSKAGNNYSGVLYLPGGVDVEKLTIPQPDNCYLKILQGSDGVEEMFLSIDESMGTIKAMNEDLNHKTKCFGTVFFEGKEYYIAIKGRGNSTWREFDKKPYNISFYESGDYYDSKTVSLIENTESKGWSILANTKDPTCLRNKVGYDIAEELGIGLPSRSIDVWMNGEYLGNYLLTPKYDYKAPSDGYMVEIDNSSDVDQFTLKDSPLFTVKDMADDLTVDDVKNSVGLAWDALRKTNSDEYLKYFDLDSWAKMYLLNELYKDQDVNAGSIFFTKASMDDSSKLIAGPIWDLDGTMGRVGSSYISMNRQYENSGGGWYIDGITSFPAPFFQLLGKHESFMRRVYEIYDENKSAFAGILTDLDTQQSLITDSAKMNFDRWPQYMINTEHYSVVNNNTKYGKDVYAVIYQKTDTWQAFTNNLKEYITKRLSFFSDKLTVTLSSDGAITGIRTLTEGEDLILTADSKASGYQWQESVDGETWIDIDAATSKTYSANVTTDMNGLLVRCIARYVGSPIDTACVAKAAPSTTKVLAPMELLVREPGFIGIIATAASNDVKAEFFSKLIDGQHAYAVFYNNSGKMIKIVDLTEAASVAKVVEIDVSGTVSDFSYCRIILTDSAFLPLCEPAEVTNSA